jgi:hypothetical protein
MDLNMDLNKDNMIIDEIEELEQKIAPDDPSMIIEPH